jgi:hypothetical protein
MLFNEEPEKGIGLQEMTTFFQTAVMIDGFVKCHNIESMFVIVYGCRLTTG